MKTIKHAFWRVIAGIVVLGTLFGSLLSVLPAQAQVNDIGSGLSISPTRTDLTVPAGTSSELKISIKNVTGGNILAKAYINDFESDGVSGEPRLLTNAQARSAASIRDLLVGLEDVPLQDDETKELTLTVQVPVDAAPGAYYGVVRYQAVEVDEQGVEKEGGQVALTASVGSLVLIEVPGNITQRLEIKNLSAYLGDTRGTLFTKQPTHVGVEIVNQGNSFARPFGKVSVKSMFGKNIVTYEMNNTDPRGVVLPNATRLFKDEVSGVSWPGRYTISADISYTNGGQTYSVSSSFWYLPIWFLIALLVLVLIIVIVVWLIFRKARTRSTRRR